MLCVNYGFPWWLSGKESTCNARDMGSIPGWGRSPGEEHGNPLQCCCLENTMDRGAWWATGPGVTKVRHDWSNGARTQACMSVTSIKLEKRIKQNSTRKISNWLNSHSYLACHFCINTHSINGKYLSFLDTLNFIRMSISGFWSLPPFTQLH